MTSKNKKSCSPESISFRRLTKEEKYEKVLAFCVDMKRTPSTSNVTESERVLGQFYTNNKSAQKNGILPDWEVEMLNKIFEYSPKRNTRLDKLNRIIDYCIEHNKTPSQSSKDPNEKKLGQLLNTVKNSIKYKLLTDDEQKAFNSIDKFRSNYQRTREEKLNDVLEFCKKHDRTPRQHVNIVEEKRLAEFLSTTRILYNRGALDKKCQTILKIINAYSPMDRTEKIIKLRAFANKHHVAPKLNSNSLEERQLAIFFTKMKFTMKNGKLKQEEKDLMQEVMRICNIKTRLDKIKDLHAYAVRIGRVPKLNTDNEDERKFAMFLNNIKQARRNGRLDQHELDALYAVETSHQKTYTSFS